nr:hypothetical protein [Paracoccus aminovorans]
MVRDLERGAVIDLLPDREPATVAAWLGMAGQSHKLFRTLCRSPTAGTSSNCKRCVPVCSPPRAVANPQGGLSCRTRPWHPDRRRAPSISRASETPTDQRTDPVHGAGRRAPQADRPYHRPQPRARPSRASRRT